MKGDLLELLIDSSTDLIYKIDLDTNEIVWYKDVSKQLNFPTETELNSVEKLLKRIHPNHKKLFLEKLNKKTNQTIEYEIEDFFGRYQTWEDRYVFTSKNLIVGICKDITENVNELMEVSADGYQSFFEANKIPVLIISPRDGRIIDANFAALNFYGYNEKEIKNLHIYDINILSQEEINHEMQLAKKEQRDCFNFRHRKKDGEIIDVEVYSGPLNSKKQSLLYSVIFDVSKRRKAEYELMQANTIYQNTKEGIFITDLEGRILSANKAFEEILGYTQEEVLRKRPSILKSNKHDKEFYKVMWNDLIFKGVWEGEIINKTKKGKFIPQWLTINTVYNEDNQPINYISVFSDFTKLKEQEKLIREKDQIMFHQSRMAAMGEMLRNIAHQWRQPLAVISVASSGLKLKKDLNMLEEDDFEDYFDSITKSTQYLSDTIEDFSNYFKNEKVNENFHIDEPIKKALQLLKGSLKNNDIHVKLNLDENPIVHGVKNELVQVLLNIVNNSKDAYKARGTYTNSLEITSKQINDSVEIIITDNAGGIDDEIIPKVFDPYFTTKHQSQGTGIGLYMSQEIIINHMKGLIEVHNIYDENKNKTGAKFIVTLPTINL